MTTKTKLRERRALIRALFMLAVLVYLLAITMTSCTKGDYIQKPTCFRYLELSDKWDGEMIYMRTDTIWANDPHSQIACNDDTAIFYKTFPLTGCATGWQQFRYIKQSY